MGPCQKGGGGGLRGSKAMRTIQAVVTAGQPASERGRNRDGHEDDGQW